MGYGYILLCSIEPGWSHQKEAGLMPWGGLKRTLPELVCSQIWALSTHIPVPNTLGMEGGLRGPCRNWPVAENGSRVLFTANFSSDTFHTVGYNINDYKKVSIFKYTEIPNRVSGMFVKSINKVCESKGPILPLLPPLLDYLGESQSWAGPYFPYLCILGLALYQTTASLIFSVLF